MTRRLDSGHETWPVLGFKALLYGVSLVFYLLPLSSTAGIVAAVLAAAAGMALALLAHKKALRLPVSLAVTALGLGAALLLGQRLLDSEALAGLLGVQQSLKTADVLIFGCGTFFVVFLLRRLSHAVRGFSLLEVVFVAGSVVAILADHRNRMINRPRILSDWAWAHGIDPGTVLAAVGIGLTLVSIFLFLRGQTLLKLLATLALLLALGVAYFLVQDGRIQPERPRDALGLTGKGEGEGGKGSGSEGGGGGSGGGDPSKNPFKNDYTPPEPPSPVAIAVLRDDITPRNQIIYFRQVVHSRYNGHHLVRAGDKRLDADVITTYPRPAEPVVAAPEQSEADHLLVPTTMYLLVDHPQPFGLGHPKRYELVPNPNPQQFVAAYDVRSLVLAVPTKRLLGRRSLAPQWDAKTRAHYTAYPDDPRYLALSDIIVREVDPRFASDDMAKAYAIKRYLEREGFYTLRSRHTDAKDPTASFLFGSLRGYCVHFAHAAAFLFRSQGIASRVALGYAVQTTKRGGGSSILIMSDRAHAWPEIHLEGIGWVTFDIYPERTDMPPPQMIDYDLEKLLGELARNDKTAGVRPDATPLEIPWLAVIQGTGLLLLALLMLAYAVKGYRRLAPRLRASSNAYPRLAYLAVLDRLSDLGQFRRRGETRERHAARLAALAPHLDPLTRAHLSRALGAPRPVGAAERRALAELVRQVEAELKQNVPRGRRAVALLNPVGWLLTR